MNIKYLTKEKAMKMCSKIIFVSFVFFFLTVYGYAQDVAKHDPLRLSLKIDKNEYFSGDKILFTYEITNVSPEPIGFYVGAYRGDIGIPKVSAYTVTGMQYDYNSPIDMIGKVMPPLPEEYVFLKPNEKWSREFSCPLIWGKLKNLNRTTLYKKSALNKENEYTGLYLQLYSAPDNEFWARHVLLSDAVDQEIRIAVKFVTFDPNPGHFTAHDCKNADSLPKVDIDHPTKISPKDKKDYHLALYCQHYEELSKSAWVGELNSDPIALRVKNEGAK